MRKSQGQDIIINNPSTAEIIKLGDILIAAGPDDRLEELLTVKKNT